MKYVFLFRFQDKLMSIPEFLDSMRRKNRLNSVTSTNTQTNIPIKNDNRAIPQQDSRNINIVFFTEEKLSTNMKRRYENQVNSKNNFLHELSIIT